ncbi:glycosyltransferase family 2 protein [Sulfurimonas sp. RIFOXYB12_FULL_35_9]|uniref:glycosyltransferase family 2 protein n=1 Tax=Sulfurimonas sp. RIFOXYB12_FULL_35_9 TaxID=1802256 RepID=UPI0008BFC7D4|nr:glycosyltransferase family 2 protein [Sulfurimonas sp. RIFOXYB12_FULL_35_9]MBS4069384.1 glycosyltransferase [Sulfurimonas sp.]OHE04614.1 MAG: glycosyl transferase [Sulfurimonas sp. RIFOXYB12_FULL_35_9]
MKYILSSLLLASLLQVFLWLNSSDKFISPPDAENIIESLSYAPYTKGDSKQFLSEEEIIRDLELLKQFTNKVRLYSAEDSEKVMPAVKKLGMQAHMGLWLSPVAEDNEKEVALAKSLITDYYENLTSVIVGNEVLLRDDLSPDELIVFIQDFRKYVDNISKTNKEAKAKAIKDEIAKEKNRKARVAKEKELKEKAAKEKEHKVLITTAEIWNMWLLYPNLADEVDFITIHILPYWEKIKAESFEPFFKEIYKKITDKFEKKPILIGEFGWPSQGYNNQGAVASPENQATIIRRFLVLSKEEGFSYNLLEAFDQPWKGVDEGSVGQYWGIFDADRKQKFEMQGSVLVEPYWFTQMTVAALIGAILTFFGLRNQHINFLHAMTYGLAAQGISFGIVMSAVYPFVHYMNFGKWVMWGMGTILMVPLTLITLAKANELFKCTIGKRPRRLIPLDLKSEKVPFVSIHVPAYKEQPHVLKETLEALSKLNYTNYEVLVIINNTPEDFYKAPIKALCEELGDKFIYLDIECTGFKAGALNKALDFINPDTDILAVIDADYVISPNWLVELVPIFDDPKVALVQAPQDHRDGKESLLKTAMNAEYAGFFDIGMVERNEENAIVAHGTMLMVRLSAFNEVGKWNTDTIVEDSELGLRLFEAGYIGHYTNRRYGYGLLPDTIEAFKNQRHRWAYGAIQILKKHWSHFKPSSRTLTRAQKHHFITGWFFWLSDALGTVTSVLNIIWVPVIIFVGVTIPTIALTVPILTAFLVNVIHSFVLYRTRVKADFYHSLLGAIAAMSLQLTIFKAVYDGFVKDRLPFVRTEKGGNSKKSFDNPVKNEIILATLLIGSFIALTMTNHQRITEVYIFSLTLLVQSIPYISAIVLRLIEKSSQKIA